VPIGFRPPSIQKAIILAVFRSRAQSNGTVLVLGCCSVRVYHSALLDARTRLDFPIVPTEYGDPGTGERSVLNREWQWTMQRCRVGEPIDYEHEHEQDGDPTACEPEL